MSACRYNVLQFTIGLARGRRANLYREVARKEVRAESTDTNIQMKAMLCLSF